jgi:hypothetical protein
MAKARVPATWIEHGTLPPQCARHERPATHLEARTFYSRTPSWVYVTILAGLLVTAILTPRCARR